MSRGTTSSESDINAVVHSINFIFVLVFYLICRYYMTREDEPPPEQDDMLPPATRGGKNTMPDPEYERGANFHFTGQWCVLSAIPSLLYFIYHAVFVPLCDGDTVRENMPPQFNKNAYLRQQLLITLFIVGHVLLRLYYDSNWKIRHQHVQDVTGQMRIRGHERVLVVNCGKGEWVNSIAKCLDRGGKVTGIDDWLSKDCPFDSSWAMENMRREGTEARVLIEAEPKDPSHLDMKDECADMVVIPNNEEADEARYYTIVLEMNRILKPGGRFVSIQPFIDPTIVEDMLEEIGYVKTRREMIRTGYCMHKVIVGLKPEEAGPQHARDGQAATGGISMVDSDYLNESPAMGGMGLQMMLVLMTLVGLYFTVLILVFLYFEWEQFNKPEDFRTYNRVNGGLLCPMAIWFGYAFIAVYFEMHQRNKYMLRRVGIVKTWLFYILQYVGAAFIWVVFSYLVRLFLRQYSLTAQSLAALTMLLPTLIWAYIIAKLRIFESMSSWKPGFGTRPDDAPSRLKQFVESAEFNVFMMGTIVLAGALVGCSTDPLLRKDALIQCLEKMVLIIFIIEFFVKLAAEWPKPWLYFMDYWNIFDFVIVFVGVLNWILSLAGVQFGGDFVMVIRLFRLARVFKVFKQIQQLRIVVSTLFIVLPGVGFVGLLAAFFMYIFACTTTYLYQDNDPKFFGHLYNSLISGFDVMTRRWSKYFFIEFYGCREQYKPFDQDLCIHNSATPGWAILTFPIMIFVMGYIFTSLLIAMVIVQIEPAIAQVKREDWEEAEEEEPGSGGPMPDEVKDLLAKVATQKTLKQMQTESDEFRNDIQRLRRMILYIRPRHPQAMA